MAVLKCKMCGGDIEVSQDKTFGTCDSCGSTMTFPKIDDEQRANMFNRGNHFRRMGEFDKALAVYERILQEDETDAEAHWCCVLCRFGIEYVEDPSTFEFLPTCHRASFDSILEDVDYLAAIEHSDGITRRQYQKEAVKISEVQKGILATSQNEEPFDVFICYKESEDDGTRTHDSTYAQDIYYQLTEQGWRVFFSRITLEDKAGTEYEPYIFAALNSAKVMIMVTTSEEHANAVWVKNEWSRFLALMRKDRSKLLIPCYRDMDPYDLPEALSVLQSYDMNKIGFVQDLIRGINKVLGFREGKPVEDPLESSAGQSILDAQVTALLKRGFLSLEDGEYARADEFFEQALNNDAENAQAYLGKLMVELQVREQDDLKNYKEPFDSNNNYLKAIRFGNEQFIQLLKSYNQHIQDRIELETMERRYKKAVSTMNQASNVKEYEEAIEAFQDIADYKDTSKNIDICNQRIKEIKEKAEKDKKEAVYKEAISKMKRSESVSDYQEALNLLQSIPAYKDADERVPICKQKLQKLKEKAEAEQIAAVQRVDAVIAALEKHLLQKNGGSLYDQLKAQEKILAELKRQQEALPGLVKDKTENEQEVSSIIKSISELQSKRQTLGLFARKEKAAIDTQLQQLNDEKTKLLKANADIEAKTNCWSNVSQIEEEIRACKEQIAKLKNALQREENSSEISYEEALKYTNSPAMRIEIRKRKPELSNITEEIEFGNYHGKIEWKVIDRNKNKLLLISKYGLDTVPYNEDGTETTWEKSTIRQWLNDTFFKEAFSIEEQKQISNTSVIAERNPKHSTDPGADTDDRVFLLSISEMNRYLDSYEARICAPTDYAKIKGAYVNDKQKTTEGKAICSWWLRSPGDDAVFAALVDKYGDLDLSGILVQYQFLCVRPAIWVDLE